MTKLSETIDDVEVLKVELEYLFELKDEELLDNFERFDNFRKKLDSLISTIAKYRIQLNITDDDDKVTFGAKAREKIQALVYNYDKLYELYEEFLVHRFAPVEVLYEERLENVEGQDENVEVSIQEETRKELEHISAVKDKLKSDDKYIKFDKFVNTGYVYFKSAEVVYIRS